MLDGRLTRRHVVRAGAALGAAAWLGSGPGTGVAVAAESPRFATLRVGRSGLRPGRVSRPIAAPQRFDLLGAAVAELRGVGLRVRTRRSGGGWSAWQPLDGHDGHAPDGRRAAMSDPIWFGDADELQLFVRRRPVRDLRLDLVGVAPAVKRRTSRATVRAAASGGMVATERAAGTSRATKPTIIPRSAWSAPAPRNDPASGQVQVAFVHHTVNGNAYGPTDSAAIVRAIADYHIRSNGWSDIGYNFLVDRYGQVFEGRAGGIEQPIVGAQAVGWNSVSTGIAIIGTFEGEPAPDAAIDAVAELIGWKLPLHGAPTAGAVELISSGGAGNRWARGASVAMQRVSGHQDGCSTDCPGKALYAQLESIRARVGNVRPASVAQRVLTVSTPEVAVGYGQELTLEGQFTVGGAGVAGASIVIQKKGPSGRWVPLTRATTDGDGRWATTVTWRAAAPVRAVADGVTSKQITPGLDPALSLSQPSRHVKSGRTVLVRGRARGVDDVSIVLRRKQGSRYILASRRKVKVKRGKFSGRLPVRRPGRQRVTVEASTAGHRYESARRYLRGVR